MEKARVASDNIQRLLFKNQDSTYDSVIRIKSGRVSKLVSYENFQCGTEYESLFLDYSN